MSGLAPWFSNHLTLRKITEAINLPLWMGAAWPGTQPIPTTRAALFNMSTGVGGVWFTPGQKYRIPHQTNHTIFNTADRNTAAVEYLIVEAISTSKLSPVALSESYPSDIIHYELVCTHTWGNPAVLIDPVGQGWIYFRKDIYDNELDYDFRNVKWRRWNTQVDGLGTWTMLTDPLGGEPYQDFLTFNGVAYGNHLALQGGKYDAFLPNYNNVFLGNAFGITHTGQMSDNTFLGEATASELGLAFNTNVLGNGFNYNRIIDAFWQATTGANFSANIFSMDCRGLIAGAGVEHNKINHSLVNAEFEDGCSYNEIHAQITTLFLPAYTVGKVLRDTFSSFEGSADISAATTLALNTTNNYAGILHLMGGVTENLNRMTGARDFDIELRPAAGLALTLTGTAVAALSLSGQFVLDGATVVLNGSKGESAVFRKKTIGIYSVMVLIRKNIYV